MSSTTDLTVIGSGASGLVAALTAASAGAAVIVLESSGSLGGTSALSGGMVFAPGNPLAAAEGHQDTREDVEQYLRAVARRPLDDTLTTFLDTIPEVVEFLLSLGLPLRTSALQDYYRTAPGASAYRSIAPQPCDPATLGDDAALVRVSPYRAVVNGEPWTNGMALVGHLVRACREAGVQIETGWRATDLVIVDGAVVGVRGEHAGEPASISSTRGVVLAGGGFEFDPELLQEYFAGRVEGAWSCPANDGAVLRMAKGAGAAVDGLEVQWYPLLRLTDELLEGSPRMSDASPARNLPGSIVVDSNGRRVVNESALYQDVARELGAADGPCWLVVDGTFVDTYGDQAFGGERQPEHWRSADSVAALAASIGVDAWALEETVRVFNKDAEALVDSAFARGASDFDQSWGDSAHTGPRSCLAPLTSPTYYATRIYAGCSGTTGGPVIDRTSRVLDPAGKPIAGLFAAGNVVANPFGGVAPSSGGTLGPAFTTGFLAGRTAAGQG